MHLSRSHGVCQVRQYVGLKSSWELMLYCYKIVSTATFFLLHCDEWDRVVALPRHKFVTGATLLQLKRPDAMAAITRQYSDIYIWFSSHAPITKPRCLPG
jgi:hypothetical protein